MSSDSVEKAKQNINNPRFTSIDAIKKGMELIDKSSIAMVGSIGTEGYPLIKAMLKMETEGVKTVWFSTNTSSKRVALFSANPHASVYFVNENEFKGLLLVGEMLVLNDLTSRQRLWREGFEVYYPLGVTDPDYAVLRFSTKWGNYYHGLQNAGFEV